MSFGVMGGNMQPQGHLQTLVRMLDYRQKPQAACDAPRWRFNQGRSINVEATMPAATREGLRALGHQIEPFARQLPGLRRRPVHLAPGRPGGRGLRRGQRPAARRPGGGVLSESDATPGTGRRDLLVAQALIFVAPALWSVNYLVARWAPGVIAPHALALGRWTVAALVLLIFCHREIAAKRHLVRGEAWHFIVLGALGMWVCGAFVYIGGRSTAAVNIGLLYAASPVLIALASALWLRERFGVLQAIGVALALAGVLHVLLRGAVVGDR